MKKLSCLLLLSAIISNSLFSQIKINNDGKIGIGTNAPSTNHNITLQGGEILFRDPVNYNNYIAEVILTFDFC